MSRTRDTRWRSGPRNFDDVARDLPPELSGLQVIPMQLADAGVPEVALFVLDRSLTKKAFAQLGGVRIGLRAGALATPGGALGALVLPLIAANGSSPGDRPDAAYATLFDPADASFLDALDRLAAQSHWHLFVIGRGRATLGVFEYDNTYGLAASVASMRASAKASPLRDRAAAHAHVERRDVSELWRLLGDADGAPAAPAPEGHRLVCSVARADVERGSVEEVAAFFEHLGRSPSSRREHRAAVDLTFAGFDHDARALWGIVAVRSWCARLVWRVPDLMFYLDPKGAAPRVVMLCMTRIEIEAGGTRIRPEEQERFFAWAYDSMMHGFQAADLDETDLDALTQGDDLARALSA